MPGLGPENQGNRTVTMAFDAASEARGLIGDIGARLPFGTPLKTVQAHVARMARPPERRIRALWNGEVRRPHDDEMKALRQAVARGHEEAARDDFKDLRERISRLEAFMASVDPDFYGPSLDALRNSFGDRKRSADASSCSIGAVDRSEG